MIGHCGRRDRIQFDRGFRSRLTAPNSVIAMAAKPSAARSASRREEERDDEDRDEVVEHREREQEDAHAGRQEPPEHGEHAEREGDVGRRRDRPAVDASAVPAVNARKIPAGTTTPPIAAIAGSIAFESELSSPMTSSRFSSTATMKKKIASSPSLIQWPVERSSPSHGRSRWASFSVDGGGSERQVRDDEAEHGRDQQQCGGEALGAEDVHGTPVGKSRCDGRGVAPGVGGWRRHPTSADQASRHSAAILSGRPRRSA